MMQDSQKFWEKQATDYKTAFERLDELAQYLDRTESRHVFSVIRVRPEDEVLDLGCGTGRWAFAFAEKCRYVLGVDFSKTMIRRAQQIAEERGVKNVEFAVESVQMFQPQKRFDIIIISGVLVYFDDSELESLIQNVRQSLKPGGRIISRETVAIHKRIDVRGEYNEKIGDYYSATYRTADEYHRLFQKAGLELQYSHDFTPTNFPMILYRRLIPRSWRSTKPVRRALAAGLWLQYWLDPLLLRFPVLYKPIMNRFWKIKSMLFVYGID